MIKLFKFTISISLLTLFFAQNRIQINIPTPEQETQYIWQSIKDISFFEKNNYTINLPKGELIEELKLKAKNGKLADDDYSRLKEFFGAAIYREEDYKAGWQKIKNNETLLNEIINKISKPVTDWKFNEFDTYQINLTLYGPGGSYNPEKGSILIYTTKEGKFKQYENPSNTIIHEIVHIGIEETIIQKFNVPHRLKERIVDLYVKINFGNYLNEYRLQSFGDQRIDNYISKPEDFNSLRSVITNLLKDNGGI